jgi:hypothetical protein
MAAVSCAGIVVLISNLRTLETKDPWLVVVLCLLASLALILKVEGPTNKSHYTFSFVVYGFTFATLGLSTAVLVILVSHVMEWLWNTSPWPIQLFNTAVYLVAAEGAGLVYRWVVQSGFLVYGGDIAGIFSLAFSDEKNGIAVGGDFRKPAEVLGSVVLTKDGGQTWTSVKEAPVEFRSCVNFIPKTKGRMLMAVGTSGTDSSNDGGKMWHRVDDTGFNTLVAASIQSVWAAGPNGRIAKLIVAYDQ